MLAELEEGKFKSDLGAAENLTQGVRPFDRSLEGEYKKNRRLGKKYE
jgi:hypothetical protein